MRLVPSEHSKLPPLAVGVLVDLPLRRGSTGHVKCWERLAGAAGEMPEEIDLTVHFQVPGPDAEPSCRELAPNVRYRLHRPLFSTARLPFLQDAPETTDLSPLHPGLARRLAESDVIHTTDAYFCFAGTARWVARLRGTPLVNSIHTDTPAYSRLFAQKALRRVLGEGILGRLVIERLDLPGRIAAGMARKLERHMRRCDGLLVPERADPATIAWLCPGRPLGTMRRGIDKQAFHPAQANRRRLAARLGVPEKGLLVCFVGRLDVTKRVLTLARALARLRDQGLTVHGLFVGAGNERAEIERLLGEHCTLPGFLEQESLPEIYASSDLFVFPAEDEVSPNVVLEAKACALPVIAAPGGGGVYIREPGRDGVVIASREPEAWAAAIERLAKAEVRHGIGAEARRDIELNHPSWADVLRHDLLPIWQAALRRRSRPGAQPLGHAPLRPSA